MTALDTHPYRLAMKAYQVEYHLAAEPGFDTAPHGVLGRPARKLLVRIGTNMVARKVLDVKYVDGTLNSAIQAVLIPPLAFGEQVAQKALSQVGVHEIPWGSNSGPQVRAYQAVTGGFGAPWCASFRSWALVECGYKGKVSAWAWDFDNIGDRISTLAANISAAQEGDAVTYNIGDGHIGTYLSHDSNFVKTVDGNTNNQVAINQYPLNLIRCITRQKG